MKAQNDDYKTKHSKKLVDLEEEKFNIISEQRKIDKIIDKTKRVKNIYQDKKKELDKKVQEHKTSTKLIHFLEAEISQINKLKTSHAVCIGCEHLKEISNVDLDFESEAIWKLDTARDDITSEVRDIEILEIKSFLTNKSNNEKRLKQIESEVQELKMYSFQEVNEEHIKALEKEMSENKNELDNVLTLLLNLDIIKRIINDKELKGVIIAKQLPVLNKLINEYLEKFSSAEFNMVIEPSFKEKIITSRGVEKEFNQLSNGQKFRLTFSLIFAFLKFIEEKNAVQTNLLMADEVLDTSLDAQGRDDLLSILHEEFHDKDIIIISHNKDIVQREELFNRNINIIKENNFSKIQEVK